MPLAKIKVKYSGSHNHLRYYLPSNPASFSSPPRILCPCNFPAKILGWVAISSRSSSPTDRTHISCIGRWDSLPLSHQERPCHKCQQCQGEYPAQGSRTAISFVASPNPHPPFCPSLPFILFLVHFEGDTTPCP